MQTNFLSAFKDGARGNEYKPEKKTVDLGCDAVPLISIPAEDRNRTSPFPYGGHRFEFRAAGSSQNVSMINIVLCTAIAESFKIISDKVEAGEKAADVAAQMLKDHWKVIFNGNGYSEEWPIEAGKRGVWRIDSGVEACKRLSDPKNTKLFDDMNVMKPEEAVARTEVMYDHYTGTVDIEAKCMMDMIHQHVLPAANKAGLSTTNLLGGAKKIQVQLEAIERLSSSYEKAVESRKLRLDTMEDVRKHCDAAEDAIPAEFWTLATYKELLFLDFNQGSPESMKL